MKIEVKNISETKVILTIKLDKEALENAKKVALVKLAKEVKVAGFRAGKVPVHVAEKNISPEVLSEATLERAVSRAVAEAFTEKKIRPVDRPVVDIVKFVPNQELEFTADAEIFGKIELGDYKNLKTKKEIQKPTEKEVDETLSRIMTNAFSKLVEVDRAAKNGDEVVIDFCGKKDGVAFDGATATEYTLELGSGSFIPGFEDKLVGHKKGEEFVIDLQFPDDYMNRELASQKVTFDIKIHTVNERQTPKLDEDFIKTKEFIEALGEWKSVKDVRNEYKNIILDRNKRDADENYRQNLLKELVDSSKCPVPETVTKEYEAIMEQELSQNLQASGNSLEGYLAARHFADYDDWVKKELRPEAETRAKVRMVIIELSEVLDLKITDEEINQQAAILKQQYGKEADLLKQIDTPEVRQNIAINLLVEKTINQLVEINSKTKKA